MIIFNDNVYQWLKWITLVLIPAVTTFVCVLDGIFGWGIGDVLAKVSAALCTLIGALIGISTKNYNSIMNGIDDEDSSEE